MHVRVICNFAVSAHFLPGSSNQLADALSHNNGDRFLHTPPPGKPATHSNLATTYAIGLHKQPNWTSENDFLFLYSMVKLHPPSGPINLARIAILSFVDRLSITPLLVPESKLYLYFT